MPDWFVSWFNIVCAVWMTAITCSLCQLVNFITKSEYEQVRKNQKKKCKLSRVECDLGYLTDRVEQNSKRLNDRFEQMEKYTPVNAYSVPGVTTQSVTMKKRNRADDLCNTHNISAEDCSKIADYYAKHLETYLPDNEITE